MFTFFRDKRIFSTGCAGISTICIQRLVWDGTDVSTVEQTKMNDCYFEKKDWRICKQEVGAVVEHFPTALPLSNRTPPNREHSFARFDLLLTVIYSDGSLSRMLEKAGQRSENGDERCLKGRVSLRRSQKLYNF